MNFLSEIKRLQAANQSLLNSIESLTIDFVDNENTISFDVLLELNMQQIDVENQLIETIACFQAIEYRPVFNGLVGQQI